MASLMPGIGRSSTPAVASGVTSRGSTPVPPTVITRSAPPITAVLSALRIADGLGLDDHHTVDDEARFFEQLRDQRASGVLVLAVRHAIVHDHHEGPAQPLCTPFHAPTVVGFGHPAPGGAG